MKTVKLLYLAKWARLDILTAVSFLCTRVQLATEEDARKLVGVLGYLKNTVNQVLYLCAAGEPKVHAMRMQHTHCTVTRSCIQEL
jgi:hypothetical protein